MKALLLPLLLATSSAFRFTAEQNEELQKLCGRESSYQLKVINGDETTRKANPWTALIFMKFDRNNHVMPASIISSRHLVTANFVQQSESGVLFADRGGDMEPGTCDGDHLLLPDSYLPNIDVSYDFQKPVNKAHEYKDSFSKILIFNGCKNGTIHVDKTNVMLLETKEEIEFSKERKPICMANEPLKFTEPGNLSFYGVNMSGVFESGVVSSVECNVTEPMSCARPPMTEQGLCLGDFGGGAYKYIYDHAMLLGIYAMGNLDCDADPANIEKYTFINLGYFWSDMCNVTGICAPAAPIPFPDEDILTTPPLYEHIVTRTTIVGTTEDSEETAITPSSTLDNSTDTTPSDPLNNTIVAETFPPMAIKEREHQFEVIVAETFEKLQLNGTLVEAKILGDIVKEYLAKELELRGCGEEQTSGGVPEVHIHLQFD